MSTKLLLLSVGVLSLSACASTPDVDLKYYPTVSTIEASVKQWVTCNASDTAVFSSALATYTVTHVADNSLTPAQSAAFSINPSKMDSTFNNSDFTITYYEDGRLKGINASNVGQGQEVIQSASSLIGAAFGLPFAINAKGGMPIEGAAEGPYKAVCEVINGADKTKRHAVLELNYNGSILPELNKSAAKKLDADGRSSAIIQRLQREGLDIGNVEVVAEVASTVPQLVKSLDAEHQANFITLRQASHAKLSSRLTFNDGSLSTPSKQVFFVLDNAGTYKVPMPKTAAFGTSTFELELSEAGAITKIKYGNTGSSNAALGTLNSLAGAFDSESESAKDQADRIAQEQRLLRCQADPANCV